MKINPFSFIKPFIAVVKAIGLKKAISTGYTAYQTYRTYKKMLKKRGKK